MKRRCFGVLTGLQFVAWSPASVLTTSDPSIIFLSYFLYNKTVSEFIMLYPTSINYKMVIGSLSSQFDLPLRKANVPLNVSLKEDISEEIG